MTRLRDTGVARLHVRLLLGITHVRFGNKAAAPPSERVHTLVLEGDDANRTTILLHILGLPDGESEQTAPITDEGGLWNIVTNADPAPLKARCNAAGLKVAMVSFPRNPHSSAHRTALDLEVSGEFREWRKDWLTK